MESRSMKKALNYTVYFIIASAIILRIPGIMTNMKKEGGVAAPTFLYSATDNRDSFFFPKKNEKSLVIFWASWCLPCRLELYRINEAILNHEIPAERIYAISLDESPEELLRVLNERKYSFKVYTEKSQMLMKSLNVTATPTVAFLEGGRVLYLTTGFTPTLLAKAKSFFSFAANELPTSR